MCSSVVMVQKVPNGIYPTMNNQINNYIITYITTTSQLLSFIPIFSFAPVSEMSATFKM